MTCSTPPAEVAAVFDRIAPAQRRSLHRLRELVFQTAAADDRIGPVSEALRWGQPAYLTEATKSGTTLRLGQSKSGQAALFVHCQTRLIPEYKAAFPRRDLIESTRAILFRDTDDIDPVRHGWLIHRALTYHL